MTFFKQNLNLNDEEAATYLKFLNEKKNREAALFNMREIKFTKFEELDYNYKLMSLYDWFQDLSLLDEEDKVEKFLFFDTETSHLNGFAASIALILTDSIGTIVSKEYFELNPQVIQDEEAIAVHGLTNEYLANKPKFFELEERITNILNDSEILIAHNVDYDLGVLIREYQRINKTIPEVLHSNLDTMVPLKNQMDFIGKRKNPKLEEAAEAFNLPYQKTELHNSLVDTELMVDVFFKAINTSQRVKAKV